MPDDDRTPTDLNALADKLKQLAPQPAQLSRDALLFAAGKAAAQPKMPAWVWPSLTGLFASISVVLAGFLLSPTGSPTIQYVDRVVYIERPESAGADVPPPAPSLGPTQEVRHVEDDDESALLAEQLRMRQQVLRWGVDMLPKSPPPRSKPSSLSPHELSQWLNVPPKTLMIQPVTPRTATKNEEQD